jgi:hypothetical protein
MLSCGKLVNHFIFPGVSTRSLELARICVDVGCVEFDHPCVWSQRALIQGTGSSACQETLELCVHPCDKDDKVLVAVVKGGVIDVKATT